MKNKDAKQMQPTVLVVDDTPAFRRAICELLEVNGFAVVEAQNGIEAVEQIKIHQPHIVIADHNMPWMTGLELVQVLRTEMALHDLPIILMSTNPSKSLAAHCLQVGANAFFDKRSLSNFIPYLESLV